MQKPRTIGLLGGSFNPAHAGHLHLSHEALKRLKLDAVWWLVSPQNPLKAKSDLADYDTRLAHAQQVATHHPHIEVSDIEARQHLYYTIDTVAALQQQYPATHFVWLMGADNLAQFTRWKSWEQLFECIPIAVFDRAPFSYTALGSKAAIRYRRFRLPERNASLLAHTPAPCWVYGFMARHPLSATQLRNSLGAQAFLSHNADMVSP